MCNCKECKKEYDRAYLPKWATTKTRCPECFKVYMYEQGVKYREKAGQRLKDKKKAYYLNGGKIKCCPMCNVEHRHITKYCSHKCFFEHQKQTRLGKNNPAYRNGTRTKGKNYGHIHLGATKKYRKAFLEKNGYLFCEECGINESLRFEVHHIVFASEKPKHEHLHDFRNLIMTCIKCHNNFHSGVTREKRKHLVENRNLVELFGESIL